MKGSKIVIIILSLVLAITIIVGGAVFAYFSFTANGQEKGPSIDEINEHSVNIPEIITNLKNDDYVRISFKVQTDSKKAKKELEKRDFQVYNNVIKELSDVSASDLKSKEGKLQLEETLKNSLNLLMQDGNIVKVYITSAILQ